MSDTINVRLWKDLHRKIKTRASIHRLTINEYLDEQIPDLPEDLL